MMRIDALLQWGTAELAQESLSARADTEILLAHTLQKSRTYLVTWPDVVVPDTAITTFKHLIAQRKVGHPVAYLIEQRAFWSLDLKVSPATLIPRPETELLVETVLAHIAPHDPTHLLDLGTGSGAIALALACERPLAQVLAVDASTTALEVAIHNAQSNGLKNVTFLLSDWFSHIPLQQFDVIVSNPPYIEARDPHLQQGDVRFEPLCALVSGTDGLNDLRHIIATAPHWLNDQGLLCVEHGYNQREAVATLFQAAGFQRVRCLPDLAGNDRITLGYVTRLP